MRYTKHGADSKNIFGKLLQTLLSLLGLLTLLVLLFFWWNQPKTEPVLSQASSQNELLDAKQLEHVQISLSEETINQLILKIIEKNQLDFNMVWQAGQIKGNLPISLQGQALTAKFSGDFSIYEDQLAIQLSSIKAGQFPLPVNQAYQMIQDQLHLGPGFTALSDQAVIVIDLNQLLQLPSNQEIRVQEIQPDQGKIILEYIFNLDDVL